ncbi:hypothetical protein Droror1_Dr00000499 [Drosera rotundifolia]
MTRKASKQLPIAAKGNGDDCSLLPTQSTSNRVNNNFISDQISKTPNRPDSIHHRLISPSTSKHYSKSKSKKNRSGIIAITSTEERDEENGDGPQRFGGGEGFRLGLGGGGERLWGWARKLKYIDRDSVGNSGETKATI